MFTNCLLCARACIRGGQSRLNMVWVCLQGTHEKYVEHLLCAKNMTYIIHPHGHPWDAVFWLFSLFRQRSLGSKVKWLHKDLIVTELVPNPGRSGSEALCSFRTTWGCLTPWEVLKVLSKASWVNQPGMQGKGVGKKKGRDRSPRKALLRRHLRWAFEDR